MNHTILVRNNSFFLLGIAVLWVCLESVGFCQSVTPIESFLPYSSSAKNTRVGLVIGENDYESEETKTAFLNHYQKFAFTRWTVSANLGDIPTYREETLREFARDKKGTKPHADAVKLAYDFCYNVIANSKCAKYPVAVKYNAALLLGGLHEKEAPDSRTPATPYAPAFDLVMKCVNNPKAPEYIQIGAAKSLNAFLETGLSADQKKTAASYLFKIIQEATDANSSAGAIWKRELAIEGSRLMGDPGAKGEVVVALAKIVYDKNAPSSTRVIAASSLSSYSYSGLSLSPAPFRQAFAAMIADCLQEELERPTESLRWRGQEKRSRRSASIDMYSDDLTQQEDYKDSIYLRQRIIAPLAAVLKAMRGDSPTKGLGGIGDLGSEEEKETTNTMLKLVDKLVRDLKKEEIDIETVQDILKKNMAGFRKISQKK